MSQVSWTKQLILAIALFGLGMFAYWVEYKHKPRKEDLDDQAKKPFVLKDTSVETLGMQSAERKYAFRCLDLGTKLCKPGDNSKWEVSEPLKLKADDANVNSFVSTLNNLTATEVIDLRDETPEKREQLMKEYGLDKAAITATSAHKIEVSVNGNRVVAYLGGTHPIGDGLFAAIEKVKSDQQPQGVPDSTRVYVLPGYFKANIEKELTYWREKRILTWGAQEVLSFKLKGTRGTVEARRKDGQWVLGADTPGDIENIDSMLSAATYLSAKEFAAEKKDDPAAKEALKGASTLLTLTLDKTTEANKEPEQIVLTLFLNAKHKDAKSEASAKMYATVSNLDPLFELEGSARDRLDKSVKDLRLAKLVTSMERFAAKRLEISGGPFASKLVILNKDGKWQRDDGTAVNGDKVQSMLDKLSGNRIRDYLDLAKAKDSASAEKTGLRILIAPEPPAAKADEKTEKPPRDLLFWKAASQLYARDMNSKRKEAYVVDPAIEADLPWKKEYFDMSASPAPAAPAAPTAPNEIPGMPQDAAHGHGGQGHDGHGH